MNLHSNNHRSTLKQSRLICLVTDPDRIEADIQSEEKKQSTSAELRKKYENIRASVLGNDKIGREMALSENITKRIETIEADKKAKTGSMEELKSTAAAARKKEAWCDQPEGSTAGIMALKGNSGEQIAKEVRLNYDQDQVLKQTVEKLGLNQNSTNLELLLGVVTKITTDYIKRMNSWNEDEIMKKAKEGIQEGLLKKVMAVLQSLLEIAEAKDSKGKNPHGFNSALEVLEAFSEFTGTNFCKKGLLQNAQGELETLLLQDQPTCTTFVDNFRKYLGLRSEVRSLDVELAERKIALAKISQGKPDIEVMVKDSTLKVPETEIRIPAGADEAGIRAAFEQGIRASLEEGQPTMADNIKKDATDHFLAKLENVSPKPAAGEIFLFRNGTFENSNSPEVKARKEEERKAQEAAKAGNETPAAKAVAGVAAGAATGLDALMNMNFMERIGKMFSEFIEKIMPYIQNLIGKLMNKMEGPFEFSAKVKGWTDKFNDADRKEIQNFHASVKKSRKLDQGHLLALYEDPESLHKVLEHKKNYDPVSWDTYLARGIEEQEFPSTVSLKGSEVAERIMSRKTLSVHTAPIDQPETPLPRQADTSGLGGLKLDLESNFDTIAEELNAIKKKNPQWKKEILKTLTAKEKNQIILLLTLIEQDSPKVDPEIRAFLKKIHEKVLDKMKELSGKWLTLFPNGMNSVNDFAREIRGEENWIDTLAKNYAVLENITFRTKCLSLILFNKISPQLKSLKFKETPMISPELSEVSQEIVKMARQKIIKFSKAEALEWLEAKKWQESLREEFPDFTISEDFLETALDSLFD